MVAIIAGGLALAVTIATIIVHSWFYKRITNKIDSYTKTTGKIVGFRSAGSSSRGHSNDYFPNIEYEDNAGKVHVLESQFRKSSNDRFKDLNELEPVTIYYNPKNPEEAIMYIRLFKYLPLMIGGSFSLFLWIFAIGNYLVK